FSVCPSPNPVRGWLEKCRRGHTRPRPPPLAPAPPPPPRGPPRAGGAGGRRGAAGRPAGRPGGVGGRGGAAARERGPRTEEPGAFLGEVQYLGGLPERLALLDDDLPGRLAEAFARHPWVEKVERVEVVPPGRVRARLTYRTPVLAVWLIEGRVSPAGPING